MLQEVRISPAVQGGYILGWKIFKAKGRSDPMFSGIITSVVKWLKLTSAICQPTFASWNEVQIFATLPPFALRFSQAVKSDQRAQKVRREKHLNISSMQVFLKKRACITACLKGDMLRTERDIRSCYLRESQMTNIPIYIFRVH